MVIPSNFMQATVVRKPLLQMTIVEDNDNEHEWDFEGRKK
jgi:hypothetical protein